MARPPQRDAASRRGQTLVVETDRLRIRLPQDPDAEASFAIHTDADVMRWIGGSGARSVEEERDWLARLRDMHEDLGFAMWVVEEKESGDVVGFSGLFPVEKKGPDIEVAYHLRKDRWGRGYATEAARACLDYGFGTAGLARIVGLVHPDNHASRRVLEKCGLTYVGRGHYYEMDLLEFAIERAG